MSGAGGLSIVGPLELLHVTAGAFWAFLLTWLKITPLAAMFELSGSHERLPFDSERMGHRPTGYQLTGTNVHHRR